MGTVSKESSVATDQKDKLPMFVVQEEWLPGYQAFQSHLPPHIMITTRKTSEWVLFRVERDIAVSECRGLLYVMSDLYTYTHA